MNRVASPVRFQIESSRFEGGQLLVSGPSVAGERVEDVLLIQPHGAASVPPVGAIGLAMPMPGRRGQLMVMGVEAADKRPDLPAGASALYDADGNIILLSAGGVTMNFASRTVSMVAEGWTIEGDVTIKGNLRVEGDVFATGSIIDTTGNTNHHSGH